MPFRFHSAVPKPRRPAGDDPERLAQHAIRLLEKRLWEKHGLHCPMGIELEFLCRYPERLRRRGVRNPHRLPDRRPAHEEEDPLQPAFRKPHHSTRFFRNSPSVAYTYKEMGDLDKLGLYQNEIVFTHRGAYGPPDTPRLHNLARMVVHTRQQMQGLRGACPTSPQLMYATQLKYPFPEGYFTDVTFLPFVKEPGGVRTTNGMHINIGLYQRNGEQIPVDIPDISEFGKELALNQWDLLRETVWLIAPDACNFRRLKSAMPRWLHPKTSEGYLENWFPAANSNPFYGILLSLLAIDATFNGTDIRSALRCRAFATNDEQHTFYSEYEKNHPLPASLKEAREAFANGGKLREALDRLDPGLGDRFMRAIERMPPGKERGACRDTGKPSHVRR